MPSCRVCVCVCLCLSRSWVVSKRIKIPSIFFSPSGSHTILVFLYQKGWQYSVCSFPVMMLTIKLTSHWQWPLLRWCNKLTYLFTYFLHVTMPVSDNCILSTLKHSLTVGRAAVFAAGPLPPQDHKSGTVCRPISDYAGCQTASSGGYWRHFCSDSEVTVQCELFLTVPNRNILTYLLTIANNVSFKRRCY